MADDGKIVIELVGKDLATQQFVRSLGEMKSSMTSVQAAGTSAFGSLGSIARTAGVAILGLVSSAKLLGTFKEVTNMEAALLKMASRLNTSVETLSSLGVVARKTGMDAEAFNMVLQRIEKSAGAAAKGIEQGSGKFDEYGEEIGKGGAAWKELGIDAQKYLQLPLDQKLLALSAAFQQNVAPARQLSLMLELGSRSAGGMIVVLKEGPEAIQKLITRQIELGTITTDMAKRGSEAKTAAGDLTESLAALGREAVDVAAPGITAITNALVGVLVRTREFNQQVELMRKLFGDAAAEKAKLGKVHVGDSAGVGFWGEAAETFFGPSPEQPYKKALTTPSIDPGEKLGKGLKAAKEEAQTVVTLFDQMAWAADDTEKALALCAERLGTMRSYAERLVSGQASYASEMAGLSPMLADQLKWKELAIQKELELKLRTLDRELDEKKINQAIYNQEKGMIAVVTQAKRLNLERDKWATEGFFGGAKIYAEQRGQEMVTRGAKEFQNIMQGAERWLGQTMGDAAVDVFLKRRKSLADIGKDMASDFAKYLMTRSVARLFDLGAMAMKGKGGEDSAKDLGKAAGGLDASALELGLSAGGLLLAGIGIATNSQALVVAGMVLQVGAMAIQIYEAITATTQVSAAVALTGSAAALGGAALSLEFAAWSIAAAAAVPFLHSGGLIAHQGLIVAHSGFRSDERLALLQTGEGVLSRRDMAFLGSSGWEAIRSRRMPVVVAPAESKVESRRSSTVIHAPIIVNPRQQMTQHDINRTARKLKKGIERELGRRGEKLG